MWAIETFRETGEFFELETLRWPKTEALYEEISDDLEKAMKVFTKRYPRGKYFITVVWYDKYQSFHAEDLEAGCRNTVAILTKIPKKRKKK